MSTSSDDDWQRVVLRSPRLDVRLPRGGVPKHAVIRSAKEHLRERDGVIGVRSEGVRVWVPAAQRFVKNDDRRDVRVVEGQLTVPPYSVNGLSDGPRCDRDAHNGIAAQCPNHLHVVQDDGSEVRVGEDDDECMSERLGLA